MVMKKFYIKTLGCKVNQCESEAIADCLMERGFIPAKVPEFADVALINTCAVTSKASMQSRQYIRRIIRENPHAKIFVTGCCVQADPKEMANIKGVEAIIGHSFKQEIPEILHRHPTGDKTDFSEPIRYIAANLFNEKRFRSFFPAKIHGNGRTRKFLKIQDGCSSFCTYCIVPHTRGPSRSLSPADVIGQIQRYSDAGYHEVVLTGIHIGNYGVDLIPRTSLTELLRLAESETRIERIRLSSVEPNEISDELIELVAASKKICPHFHVPLQSGDDGILRRMGRPYTVGLFKERIEQIHFRLPDVAIGVDTLVGFPGETEEAFQNTYSMIESLPVSYLHVFPFSAREKTPAWSFPQKVADDEIKRRCRRMRILGHFKKGQFYQRFVGRNMDLLIEGRIDNPDGFIKGMTNNYIPVHIPSGNGRMHDFATVEIQRVNENNRVYGKLSG